MSTFHERPFWALGFRPFFAYGAGFSALWMALWLWLMPGHNGYGVLWHGHEMLYGFGISIVMGFLLTSTQNWSGIRGVHGLALQQLLGLWAIGRLAMLSPWPLLAALGDLFLIPLLAYRLWPYLSGEKQKRNRLFLGLFGLLTLGNLLFHGQQLGFGQAARTGLHLALHLYLVMIVVVGGRVIPVFTRNAVTGATIQSWPWLEKLSLGFMFVWIASEALWPSSLWSQASAALLALAHGLRWWGWHPWQTRHNPLLLMLPVGYAWLIIGLILRALPIGLPYSLGTHAFTVGAMGVMMYAMICRVSLGHTGRPLIASKPMVIGFILMNLAALLRVGGPWFAPQASQHAWLSAGVCWVIAFVLYLGSALPALIGPRPDGKAAG